MAKHFLSIEDYQPAELHTLLNLTIQLKKLYLEGGRDTCLAGRNMVMLFEKPSSRTRLSFQVAIAQLGGSAIYIRPEDIGGLGCREPIGDLTRVLNGYVDVIVARTFSHDTVTELARYAQVPVINALTDLAHPCQAMADILTIYEHFGSLENRQVTYVGDGNNVAFSLALACIRLGLDITLACPENYNLPEPCLAALNASPGNGTFTCTADPCQAVANTDIIYTDTWTSMGQENEKEQRIKDFIGYQVNRSLLDAAGPQAKIMHCLPAYRGLEITDEVIESRQSIVFDQAENRLHFQRALMKYLLCS